MIEIYGFVRSDTVSIPYEDPIKCRACVLTDYCTRKNICRVDGYCRYDDMDESERRRCIRNALWLVGDERWREYED